MIKAHISYLHCSLHCRDKQSLMRNPPGLTHLQSTDAVSTDIGAIRDETRGKIIIEAKPTLLITPRLDIPAK